METRAAKGGQYGKNGEWYEGGQFLPSSENTEKGKMTKGTSTGKGTTRKQEIAPYKWELSDRESLYKACAVGYYTKFVKTGYSKENGAEGYIEIYPSRVWEELSEEGKAQILENISRWNNGERWL